MSQNVKLVRDKIPEIIKASGARCEYYVAESPEYETRLYEKMREELDEFIDEPCIEEAGDMYEVFLSMLRFHKIDICDVIFAAVAKKEKRGGFLKKIVLESVENP
tara:strand:- start:9490 stop:9804 length:315 start_codon:yes stop_codon:yes gene_type:complete